MINRLPNGVFQARSRIAPAPLSLQQLCQISQANRAFVCDEVRWPSESLLDWREDHDLRLLHSAAEASKALGSALKVDESQASGGGRGAECSCRMAMRAIYPERTSEPHKIAGGADVLGRHFAAICR